MILALLVGALALLVTGSWWLSVAAAVLVVVGLIRQERRA